MKATDVVTIGVGLGVLYGLYKLFGKGGPGASAIDAVASVIAKPVIAVDRAINWIEGGGDVIPTGNIILPNGAKIPVSAVNVRWDTANNVASFVYQGYGYIIPPGANGGPAYDTNGDYHAQ